MAVFLNSLNEFSRFAEKVDGGGEPESGRLDAEARALQVFGAYRARADKPQADSSPLRRGERFHQRGGQTAGRWDVAFKKPRFRAVLVKFVYEFLIYIPKSAYGLTAVQIGAAGRQGAAGQARQFRGRPVRAYPYGRPASAVDQRRRQGGMGRQQDGQGAGPESFEENLRGAFQARRLGRLLSVRGQKRQRLRRVPFFEPIDAVHSGGVGGKAAQSVKCFRGKNENAAAPQALRGIGNRMMETGHDRQTPAADQRGQTEKTVLERRRRPLRVAP